MARCSHDTQNHPRLELCITCQGIGSYPGFLTTTFAGNYAHPIAGFHVIQLHPGQCAAFGYHHFIQRVVDAVGVLQIIHGTGSGAGASFFLGLAFRENPSARNYEIQDTCEYQYHANRGDREQPPGLHLLVSRQGCI